MPVKFKNTLLSLAIGLLASSASALSLGEAHGSVVLGRPLDLVFDIHTDPGTDLDITCIQASAQAGETLIDNSRMRIAALPVIAGRPPSVRIRSSVAVLEPILSVRLSVGCSGVVVRNYDFFAEVPRAMAASKLPLVIAPLAPPAALASAPPPSSPPPPPPPPPPRKRARPPVAAPSQEPPPALFPSIEGDGSAGAAPAPERKARLKVEPLGDWLAEANPAPLRLSPELQALPQDATSAQRTQAAALWQLLNISAQEVQQTQLRLQQVQGEMDAVRAQSEKLQTTLAALQQQVDTMDVQRFPAALLYSLLALMVVICAALVWMWQHLGPRARSGKRMEPSDSDWSYAQAMQDKSPAYAPPDDAEPSDSHKALLAKLAKAAPASVAAPLAGALTAAAVAPAATASSTASTTASSTASASLTTEPAARMLYPEQLFDLQQQAEFFISIGEHDQAIGVMKKHIDENASASPLMYLELLRLYRSLGRRDDFKALRAQFHQHFNALVPEFLAFQAGGRTLMDYAEIAASIEAVWSADAVQPLLESYIFCPAAGCTSAAEPFELPAYDDLLLLYALANTIPASERGAPPPRQRTMPHADADAVGQKQKQKQQPDPQSSAALLVDTIDPLAALAPLAASPAADDELDFDLSPFMDVALSGAAESPQALPPAAKALPPPPPRKKQDFHIDMDMDMDMGLEMDMELDIASFALDPQPAPPPPPPTNMLEYDAQWLPKDSAPPAPASVAAPLGSTGSSTGNSDSAWVLDLDLSEPAALGPADALSATDAETDLPALSDSKLSALDATPPPASEPPVGFGAHSDRFEASFSLEEDLLKRRNF